jgi:serine protease
MMRAWVAVAVLAAMTGPVMAGDAIRLLPARLPERPDIVAEGMLKVRFRADALQVYGAQALAARYGLAIDRAVLPYERSVRAALEASTLRPTVVPSARLHDIEDRLLRSYVVRYDPSMGEPERLCARLQRDCGDIEIAEPFAVPQLCAEPNDPRVGEQKMLPTIRAFDAWDVEDGDTTVLIGISDSGIRQDHEDLAGSLHTNWQEIPDNGLDDDGNGYVDDHRGYNFCTSIDSTPPGNTFNPREGHGTGVAGICGATVNNGIGIAGVANQCRLVPLKTMPDNLNGILFGYESIMYCAVNGIHVVNCSWGGFSKSCVDEDVVAYATERGTAVVAAAGNHGTTAPFYPAAYPGVLSVGVTNHDDGIVGMTGRGHYVDVMAPGQGTVTTSNDGTYGGFCCTSGASPIAAAIVGLVRSKHPQLSAEEACALVRMSADDIDMRNVTVADLIPGRVNALRAVTMPPDSIPAVRVELVSTERDQGGRWGPGDDVHVTVRFMSDLAGMRDVSAEMDVVGPAATSVQLQQINTYIGTIAAGGVATPATRLTTYKVLRDVDTTTLIRIVLRGTTTSGDDHRQTLLVPIMPSPSYTTLRNDVMAITVGDRGRLGKADVARGLGEGITFRSSCGLLYEGGLLVSTGKRVVDNIRFGQRTNDHFRSIKGFRGDLPDQGIIADADAPDSLRLGVQVQQHVRLASADSGLFVNDVVLVNTGDSVLRDVVMAWFFDWDLGSLPVENRVRDTYVSASDAMTTVVAERGDAPAVTCAIGTPHADLHPFAIGIDNTITYSLMPPRMKDSLARWATSYEQVNDIAVMTGVRLDGPLRPGEGKFMRLVIAIDDSVARSQGLASVGLRAPDGRIPEPVTVFPQPASEVANVTIELPERPELWHVSIDVVDLLGRRMAAVHRNDLGPGRTIIPIDVTSIASGTYSLVIRRSQAISIDDAEGRIVAPLSVVR